MRSTDERKRDAKAALEQNPRGWLATASPAGSPHVIAVSTWWDGERITLTTGTRSRSARNLEATGRARLVFGTPDDAILVDARLLAATRATDAAEVAAGWQTVQGWDPRDEPGDWSFFQLAPVRIQAYRGYEEHEGSDVMRDGRWIG